MKKALSLILALIFCLSLVSCGGDKTPAVMTLGDHTVTEAMYSYWASSYKGNYIYSYEDVKNTAEYWNSKLSEEETVAEYFDSVTLEAVKTNLVASKLFSDYGLSFTESELSSVKAYIADLIVERAEGSKNMMNTMLGEYGINLKILEKIYLEEEKSAKVFDHLYGEGGTKALKDEDFEKFYKDNYVHLQLIYVNDAYEYVTDSEGNRVTGEDGYYKTQDLSAEDKAEKEATIKKVQDGLAAGEDFDKLYEEYSELKTYKNGYYYSAADSYSDMLYYRLVAECEKLKDGETATVESDTGTCIIKKLPLDDGAWKNEDNADFFGKGAESFKTLVQEAAYRTLVESYFDDIVIDTEALKKFSVATVTPAYFF